MRTKIVFTAATALVMALLAACIASAAPVRFKQTITPLDCTITRTSNGSGTVATSDCPPQNPTIETINENGGRPIIRGLYDAANAAGFRVFFADRWYVLGVDSELTVIGNVWTLDLSGLDTPLAPGDYDIVVEMTTINGVKLNDTGTATVKQIPEQPPQKPDNHGGSLLPTGDDVIAYTMLGLVLVLAAAAALLRRVAYRH
ncbi:MAG TPA: hypothetical protein VFQ70_03170 [Candidatus Saccharimonadaceae bacterium]|nr:hypothetical protein [Candidatus Saccharimonadaceae bacterium]